jgi:hypothetical protein
MLEETAGSLLHDLIRVNAFDQRCSGTAIQKMNRLERRLDSHAP